ncbi:MAG: Rieske 2Fe-2S domain-containing protein [Betaproteobacteria bacterium]|nr:Rieske 2Fe-2S domain-containing protein [Betaproteobacteria bacterium]
MARTPRLICAAAALAEGGSGVRFDWSPAGGAGKGFAIRHDGAARAFVNRCPHLGVELDWQAGEFFEESGLYLVCSTHGAIFEPSTGLCVAGPCQGARLQAIAVEEHQGRILIYDDVPDPVQRDETHDRP